MSFLFSGISRNFATMNHTPIKLLKEEQRPREKLLTKGIATLTEAELIAILLRSGTTKKSALALAEDIIENIGGIEQLLEVSYDELVRIKGIGQAKALSIIAAMEIARRSRLALKQLKRFDSSTAVGQYLQERLGYLSRETFLGLFFNNNLELVKEKELTQGGLNYVMVDKKTLFKYALKYNATSIIISHNHPSGKLVPSEADINLTNEIVAAARILELSILDHIIVSKEGYFSFAEEGLL